MIGQSAKERFQLVLIKPSHYDDDGYVIQWFRSIIPSNSMAILHGLALDCIERHVLGEEVEITVSALDETNTRIRPERIARSIAQSGGGMVGLVGVQSNQFPRAMDIARRLRACGTQVCIGGFHVSGCLAMLPQLPPDIKEAVDLGISLFAGEAEGRLEEVLRDAYKGALKPLYNFMNDLPDLSAVPIPLLPSPRIKRTMGNVTSFDAGRGCPFQCSFCTIINVQGRKSRYRNADEIELIVRRNLAQGVNRFFITDDNFARNKEWEAILDRLIRMREEEKLNIAFIIQADMQCHRTPNFIDKAARAGVTRVYLGLESINPESLLAAKKRQNKITEYRKMLLAWKRHRVAIYAGYIIGFPNDTPEATIRDIGIIQRELPIDVLEFMFLTPLPGSEDHQRLYLAGRPMDPDMNKYDLEHVTTPHPRMSKSEWERTYRLAWETYYSDEHVERVMRRVAATGMSLGKMMLLLAYFRGYFAIENIHPLQGGVLRRKYRRDRRPNLPREAVGLFHLRYAAETVWKQAQIARLLWRHAKVRARLKRDPEARHYMDQALTPVADSEFDTLEMFAASDAAKEAVAKVRKPDETRLRATA